MNVVLLTVAIVSFLACCLLLTVVSRRDKSPSVVKVDFFNYKTRELQLRRHYHDIVR